MKTKLTTLKNLAKKTKSKTAKATVIYPDGKESTLYPANKSNFTLEEACQIIGCQTVEVIGMERGRGAEIMIVDEEGHLNGKSYNHGATTFAQLRGGIPSHVGIVGIAVVCNRKMLR